MVGVTVIERTALRLGRSAMTCARTPRYGDTLANPAGRTALLLDARQADMDYRASGMTPN